MDAGLGCDYALHHLTRRQSSFWELCALDFTCLSVRGEANVLDDDLDCFTLKYTRLYFVIVCFPVGVVVVVPLRDCRVVYTSRRLEASLAEYACAK